MKLMSLVLLMLTLNVHASGLNMKPGLWEVSMSIEAEGKTIDPLVEMKKTIAKLPKEQQAQLMAAMKNNNINNISQICFTKEMIENPEKFKFDKKGKCTHKLDKQTATRMEMSLTCTDGTSGKGVMEIINSGEYRMVVTSKAPNGEEAKTIQHAKFLKAGCK